MDKVRISAISYLNSIPFVYGIQNSSFSFDIDLSLNIPSDCYKKILNNEVDIALVPIVALNQSKNLKIISSYCIASDGCVETVCLFSQVPLNKIKRILLDFHSKTSIQLLKLLCLNYWKINVEFLKTDLGFEQNIIDETAALVIGDRAYKYKNQFKHVYDLSYEWKKFTNYPFVFACWVANKKIPIKFINEFNNSLKFGLDNLDIALKRKSNKFKTTIDKENYLKNIIKYNMDNKMKSAINFFINKKIF